MSGWSGEMREEATVWGEPTHRGRVPLALDPPYVGPSVSDQKTVENGVVETTRGCCLVVFFPVGQSRSRVRRGCPPPETPRPRPQLSSCALHRWSFWTSSPWVPRSPLCHSSDPPVPLHGQPRRRCRRRLRSLLEATHACSASAPECSVYAKPHRRSIRRELPG